MISSRNLVVSFITYTLLVLVLQSNGKKSVEQRCKTCREMVENFHKGMENTAKTHFGGGDTAWEETRLGKYSRSETRLLDILDSVCTNAGSKESCYAMVEEYEEDIETFWFKKQSEISKLETYLCNDVIKVCCPIGTYGKDCKECPNGVENPCFGRGKCNGNGTRGGTGKCDCDSEYTGELCDECDEGYYDAFGNISCKACHDTCDLSCTDGTNKGCDKCKEGYVDKQDEGCVDIDECEDPKICADGKFCINKRGHHTCTECDHACKTCNGTGNVSCTECNAGWRQLDEGYGCKDIDECEEGLYTCEVGTFCVNIDGSFKCDKCNPACSGGCTDGTPQTCKECADGYKLDSGWITSAICVDVDECTEKNLACPLGQACVNKPGPDGCEPCSKDCTSCLTPEPAGCLICNSGHNLTESGCKDIDECSSNPCKIEGERCKNTKGSYKCLCKAGWVRTKDGICQLKKTVKKKDVEPEDEEPPEKEEL